MCSDCTTKRNDWQGCYKRGWGKNLTPEAFSHPAKVGFGLAERIYSHAIKQGYFAIGDKVLDPFGGIAGFAFHAMVNGLHFTGIELEPRFVKLGNENISLWNDRYAGKLPRWGAATLLQGDSRRLCEIVGKADGCVSSPPYAGSLEKVGGIDASKSMFVGGPHSQMNRCDTSYGTTPGQLGSMRPGDFDAAVLRRKGYNVGQSNGTVYVMLFDADNSVALLLKICVLPIVLCNLSRAGVPIITICFNDGIEVRKKEIAMIIGNFELPNILDVFGIEQCGKGNFELAFMRHPIASDGAIDCTTIFDAMGLSKEDSSTCLALAFNLSISRLMGAFSRAVLSSPVGKSKFLDREGFSTFLTKCDDSCVTGGLGAFMRTIAALLSEAWGNEESLSASLTDNADCCITKGLPTGGRATFTPPARENIRSCVEMLATNRASPIWLCSLKFSVTGAGTKMILRPLDIFCGDGERLSALVANNCTSSHYDTPAINSPGIISPSGNYVNFDAAVSSPPFEECLQSKDSIFNASARPGRTMQVANYGATQGNIGNESSDTFWLSARTIVEQVYLALRPGAYAAWVVKSFVRNKARVDFPAQWEQLCQSCGFVTVETVRAWLVEDNGTQAALIGNDKRMRVERKSFFRRLAERNGSPSIDYEVVLFMRKGGDL